MAGSTAIQNRAGGPPVQESADLDELRAEVQRQEELLSMAERRLSWIREIGTALGEYKREDALLAFIMERVTWIMEAERSTLYLLDLEANQLRSRIVSDKKTKEIRLAVGEGIAGWVVQHGRPINVKDAYKDPRFNSRFDTRSGFRTRSVLCQPMRNNKGEIIGAIQVLNKRNGWFTVADETVLSSLGNTAAVVLENSRLFFRATERNVELAETQRKLEERVRELNSLYHLSVRVAEAPTLDALARALTETALTLIPSAACVLTLLGRDSVVMSRSVASRTGTEFATEHAPAALGATGEAIASGHIVARDGDKASETPFPGGAGTPVRSVIAVPLHFEDRCIGGLELVNRRQRDSRGARRKFDRDDRKLLMLIAGQASAAVARVQAREQRAATERIQAIGQMLSGVLHDVKTPLTIASSYVQLLVNTEDADVRRTYARRALRQFELLDRMTREVVAYARGDSQVFLRNIQVSHFADELREQLEQEFAGHRIELLVQATYRGEARFDEGKLKRILFNLARNAREAMPDGGCYKVEIRREGAALLIRCTDSGVGIPEEIRGRLFQAFVTSGKARGTGLGLAIVKKLVDDHGGTVSFESQKGRGTTFEVRIPLLSAPRAETSLEVEVVPGVPGAAAGRS